MDPSMETNPMEEESQESILNEIRTLEAQLAKAKARLTQTSTNHLPPKIQQSQHNPQIPLSIPPSPTTFLPPTTLHLWLLLADSALPIGSFAFSSGLESYISHRLQLRPKPHPKTDLLRFLRLSLLSVSTTTVPYIVAAFQRPSEALELSDIFDASTTCTVARRASVSQGRALCTVWDKALGASLLSVPKNSTITSQEVTGDDNGDRKEAIITTHRPDHFGPAWGYLTRLSGLPAIEESLTQVLFVFLFSHVKAVLSAAVRQSLIGPYVAQSILASEETRGLVERAVERGRKVKVEEAGQGVPTLDIYQGRHEVLYSRVFNS